MNTEDECAQSCAEEVWMYASIPYSAEKGIEECVNHKLTNRLKVSLRVNFSRLFPT